MLRLATLRGVAATSAAAPTAAAALRSSKGLLRMPFFFVNCPPLLFRHVLAPSPLGEEEPHVVS
jgi:hypothetical protein